MQRQSTTRRLRRHAGKQLRQMTLPDDFSSGSGASLIGFSANGRHLFAARRDNKSWDDAHRLSMYRHIAPYIIGCNSGSPITT